MLRETGPVGLLIRLGVVFVFSLLLGAALLTQVPRSPPSLSESTKYLAKTAAHLLHAQFQAEVSSTRGTNPSPSSTAVLISQPSATELTVEAIDHRRLTETFRHGIAMMTTESDDNTRREGARLVNATAVFGYEPARALIARDYPTTPIIRSAVSAGEAVRYSLDPLLTPGRQSQSQTAFLVILASYFSGRHTLDTYATALLAALSDNRRLQTEDLLKSLLEQLARVRGACTAIARAAVKARIVTGPECSPALQLQIENFLRAATPSGREAESRALALQLLDNPTAHER